VAIQPPAREVKDPMSYFRLLNNPADDNAFYG
jgi:superfamily I DNA/RNA helicase